ncbi:MAG: lipoate--protein ligase family protein [Spirochaetales bacterium]|nr:lipoate--protein ligase family protein [Spirochaetales bacterium]
MNFVYSDLQPRNPFLNLALDEALAQEVVQLPEFRSGLRLWANPECVVLGRTCDVRSNVQIRPLSGSLISQRRAVWRTRPMICRRVSGGGTVLHGPGNLNYSIFLNIKHFPGLYNVRRSYEVILGMVVRSLRKQGLSVAMAGLSDLILEGSAGGCKISGNAQFRKFGMVVHHGTLLTGASLLHRIADILLHPPREPEYRAKRSHGEFLAALPDNFDITSFYNCLSAEVGSLASAGDLKALDGEILSRAFLRARRLVRQLYARPEWVFEGRIPDRDVAEEAKCLVNT